MRRITNFNANIIITERNRAEKQKAEAETQRSCIHVLRVGFVFISISADGESHEIAELCYRNQPSCRRSRKTRSCFLRLASVQKLILIHSSEFIMLKITGKRLAPLAESSSRSSERSRGIEN